MTSELAGLIRRLEAVFSERDEDEILADLDDGEIDPSRGYLTGDPVVDAWERAWARGETPDF